MYQINILLSVALSKASELYVKVMNLYIKRKIPLFPEMLVTRKFFTLAAADLFIFNQFNLIF